MSSQRPRRRVSRRTSIEPLEQRQVFSADPLGDFLGAIEQHTAAEPDFWYDAQLERDLDTLVGNLEQTLASANELTGLTRARNDYGFLGYGQTVAVIDSGIAWDHLNLGNGLGADYRVVGGWDFTEENDANPYDDGPAGAHGTHVAGIVGATANATGDEGVAPGVDFVGLRVFNDQGAGYFGWVEKALRWVHTNRNAFANPITAVNLSLGTAWNAATVPSWAMLEDEFAQLKADGIFVAVSAGNSFSTYNAPGLSYPAASASVVPVMSVDDGGALSYFSQRHERAIAAPGRTIRSTVPDYVGNQNGRADDWASFSGTSMASPYVAGASLLVREAMQFVGMTNITQDTIYTHIMSTADEIFDSATNATYKRLNVGAALDALMPDDDFGSNAAAAHDLGMLTSTQTIAGLIGKLDDQDYFTFTAGASGKVSLTGSGSHALELEKIVVGEDAIVVDGQLSFDVVSGQSYTFLVKAAAGSSIGYFDIELAIESFVAPPPEVVKSVVGSDGRTYTLDTEGWVSLDGSRIWENTRDFEVRADGTALWLSTAGYLARRLGNGTWQTLDLDATKFAVTDAGAVYSMGVDGWGNFNGQAVWSHTADFAVEGDGTVYWQNTDGQLYRRSTAGVWQFLASDVTKFAVRSDGLAYALRANNCVNFDSIPVWENSHDFVLCEDQSVYWQSTTGALFKLPSGGAWQLVGSDVAQFAVCETGAVYALNDSMQVVVNGNVAWSGIRVMRHDTWGRLLLERSNGSVICIGGQYSVSAARSDTLESPSAASFAAEDAAEIASIGVLSVESYVGLSQSLQTSTKPSGRDDHARHAALEHFTPECATTRASRELIVEPRIDQRIERLEALDRAVGEIGGDQLREVVEVSADFAASDDWLAAIGKPLR